MASTGSETRDKLPGLGKLSHLDVGVRLSLDRDSAEGLFVELRTLIQYAVREEVAAGIARLSELKDAGVKDAPVMKTHPGVELSATDQLTARDLRMALLMGKLPDQAGILINPITTAKLLNVSLRTLNRLVAVKAVPQPCRLAAKISRWRLAELLEWIEAGCPHTKHWTYSPDSSAQSKRRR